MLAAVGLSMALVWQSSYAAYSATTANPTSSWASGSVVLADDDSGTALFSVTNLKPGSTGTRCITVTSTGSLPATVQLYGTGLTTTKALSSHLTLSVTSGTGGSFGSCSGYTSSSSLYSGTLAAFSPSSYATGIGAWSTTGNTAGETRTYQFTYTLSSTAPDSTQGGSASIGLTWEAQNT